MNQMATSLADNIVQCWGCAVFDRLFQIISTIGIEIYERLTQICLVIFGLLFAIFVFNAIWKNFKGGIKDPIMKDSFLKAFIRSVFALTLLGAGTLIPKTISTVIFEPVTKVTLLYSQSMIKTNDEIVSARVTYEPIEITQEGIYSQKELIEAGKKLVKEGNKEFINSEINPEEMSIMLFTSGTTSASKIVALSHKNVCTNIMDLGKILGINSDDTFLSILPINPCVVPIFLTAYCYPPCHYSRKGRQKCFFLLFQ